MGSKKKTDKKRAKKIKTEGASRPRTSTEPSYLVQVRFLVVSGENEMKVSRSVDARPEDINESGVFFQTTSMIIDELHLSYDKSPLIRNKLIIELQLPNQPKRIRSLAEVSWYERSLVSQEEIFHVSAKFKEMSHEDRELLKAFLLETKKSSESISIK
jgi:hypothetical protein